MSFLSDLIEGNFGNLGTDIVDAPSSLINNPSQLLETAAAVAVPFLAPEVLGALGIGDVGALAAGDAAAPAFLADVAAPVEADVAGGAPLDILAATGAPAATDAAGAAATGGIGADIASALEAGGIGGDLGTPVGAVNGGLFAPTTASTEAVDTLAAGAGAPAQAAAASSAPAAAAGAPLTPSEALAGNPNITALAAGGPDLSQAEGIQAINGALSGPPSTAYAAENAAATGATDAAMGGSPVPFSQPADLGAQFAAEGSFPGSTAVGAAAPTAPTAADPGILGKAASFASNPLVQMALPAGLLGYNLLKGPAPIPPQANEAVANAKANLAPLQGAATQNVPLYNQTAATDLNLAQNFQISPAQAASIATWKQDQLNALYQQIANQGNANPTQTSEYIQGKNQIDQQALAQQVQMVNQLVSTAMASASAANAAVSTSANVSAAFDSTLMQAAQLQIQQDTNFQNAVGSALQAFGLVAGLNANRVAGMANSGTLTQGLNPFA